MLFGVCLSVRVLCVADDVVSCVIGMHDYSDKGSKLIVLTKTRDGFNIKNNSEWFQGII